jgi:hypothetical protein
MTAGIPIAIPKVQSVFMRRTPFKGSFYHAAQALFPAGGVFFG